MKKVRSLDCDKYPNPTQAPDLIMGASDGRFRVHVGHQQWATLLAACRRSGPLETGGLLVGRYNELHDTAVVTGVWGPPTDSVRTRTSFRRGIRGLQRQLNSLWGSGEYYLGEWHYHPDGSGQPSNTDMGQMVRIAKSLRYNTPEPILIVVGGAEWDVIAHVFPRNCSPINLARKPRASRAAV